MAAIRLTPSIRQQINESEGRVKLLAEQFGVTEKTIRKWRRRTDMEDQSHRTKRSSLILGPVQERIVCELRVLLQLSLDDLLALTRALFQSNISRAALARRLTQHGINTLDGLLSVDEKPLDKDVPGTLLIVVRPLPLWSIPCQHRYLFIAIDVATHWIFAKAYDDATGFSYVDFLYHAQNTALITIKRVLTESVNQALPHPESKEAFQHPQAAIEQACLEQGIAYGCFKSPLDHLGWEPTKFAQWLDQGLDQNRFPTPESLEADIQKWLFIYNQKMVQRSLGRKTPKARLKAEGLKSPNDFYHEQCRKTLGTLGAHLFLELDCMIGNAWTWQQRIDLAKGIQKKFAPKQLRRKTVEITKLTLVPWTKTIRSKAARSAPKKNSNEVKTANRVYVISHLILKCPLKDSTKPNLIADFDLFFIFERTHGVLFDFILERPKDQIQSFQKFKDALDEAEEEFKTLLGVRGPTTPTVLLPKPRLESPRLAMKEIKEALPPPEEENFFTRSSRPKTGYQVQFYHGKEVPPLFVEFQSMTMAQRWLEKCRRVIPMKKVLGKR